LDTKLCLYSKCGKFNTLLYKLFGNVSSNVLFALAKCKKLYPIGTKINWVNSPLKDNIHFLTISGDDFEIDGHTIKVSIIETYNGIPEESHKMDVFDNNWIPQFPRIIKP